MATGMAQKLALLCKTIGVIVILAITRTPLNNGKNSVMVLGDSAADLYHGDYGLPAATQSWSPQPPQRYYNPQQNLVGSEPGSTKRATAIKLTKSRINDAQIYLAEVSDSPSLIGDCPKQLDAVNTKLSEAARSMGEEGSEDAAARALDEVEATLDDCIETMARIQTPEGRQARATLRQVTQPSSPARKICIGWLAWDGGIHLAHPSIHS